MIKTIKEVKKKVNYGVNGVFHFLNHNVMSDISTVKNNPVIAQKRIFDYLIKQGKKTKF
jgi:hypothetical protein